MTAGAAGPGRALSLDAVPAAARPMLAVLAALLGDRPAWLVGGAVRDGLLGVPVAECDVAVPAGALALARALADRLGAAYVALDEPRGAGRVVGEATIDVGDLRGPDLAADLRGRDFTVNALAVALGPLVGTGAAPVEDPTGGLADLQARAVRLCAASAIQDDPVRALRAARFGVRPGWRVDAAVEEAAAAAAGAIGAVSAERVRDELGAILQGPSAGQGLRWLDRVGVLGVLLPERGAMRATAQPAPHRFDVWEHCLRSVEAADCLVERTDALAPWGARLATHLQEGLGDGLTRATGLKLAALLHDVAKPETRTEIAGRVRFIGHDVLGAERAEAIARRLRLSRRFQTVLSRLVRHHLRPMHLEQAGQVTRRARFRFFRDLGDDALDLLLLALADAAAVRGDDPLAVWAGRGSGAVRTLLGGLDEERRVGAAPPLVRGEDVMAALGLAPGPEVGRLLALAREAQALGLVGSRDEALAYLRTGAARFLDTSTEPL